MCIKETMTGRGDLREAVGPHEFHIPVMGTGFSLDSPLRVGPYGINSVVSLVDDVLIEQVHRVLAGKADEPFTAVPPDDQDVRARRITAYLDFLDRMIERRQAEMRKQPFDETSELTRYFRLLPAGPLKTKYEEFLAEQDEARRAELEKHLRSSLVPGLVDVNVMVKVDAPHYRKGEMLPDEYRDAMAAARGFAKSTCRSAIVLSAGMNKRLYAYLSELDGFIPGPDGAPPRKQIVLKVSDYRSALLQGRLLARHGLWVSEYRIESGLNCGGHAFASKGALMGPILDEFDRQRDDLSQKLGKVYLQSLEERGLPAPAETPRLRVTVQGGVGTHAEHDFLLRHYHVDAVGWATAFLFCPEAVNIDKEHLDLLCAAGEDDISLSKGSPLNIRFWRLNTSASERARKARIIEGQPGSACPKGYVANNFEFTERGICNASRFYQQRKLAELEKAGLSGPALEAARRDVLEKACICHELGGSVMRVYGIDDAITPTVCCGPGAADFSRPAKLEEVVDHIYGRMDLMTNPARPHMFIRELDLYVSHLLEAEEDFAFDPPDKVMRRYWQDYCRGLRKSINYYHSLVPELPAQQRAAFTDGLNAAEARLAQSSVCDQL